MTVDLFKDVGQMKSKLVKPPDNIEELTGVLDYMLAVPSELEKIKKETEKSMEIY